MVRKVWTVIITRDKHLETLCHHPLCVRNDNRNSPGVSLIGAYGGTMCMYTGTNAMHTIYQWSYQLVDSYL